MDTDGDVKDVLSVFSMAPICVGSLVEPFAKETFQPTSTVEKDVSAQTKCLPEVHPAQPLYPAPGSLIPLKSLGSSSCNRHRTSSAMLVSAQVYMAVNAELVETGHLCPIDGNTCLSFSQEAS